MVAFPLHGTYNDHIHSTLNAQDLDHENDDDEQLHDTSQLGDEDCDGPWLVEINPFICLVDEDDSVFGDNNSSGPAEAPNSTTGELSCLPWLLNHSQICSFSSFTV